MRGAIWAPTEASLANMWVQYPYWWVGMLIVGILFAGMVYLALRLK